MSISDMDTRLFLVIEALTLGGAAIAWWLHRRRPVTLTIEGPHMPNINEGASDSLKVVAKNQFQRVVKLPADTAVKAAVATDAVTVIDQDGGFVFTAGIVAGDDGLVATGGGLTSAPYVETVVADDTPATLEIQPAA